MTEALIDSIFLSKLSRQEKYRVFGFLEKHPEINESSIHILYDYLFELVEKLFKKTSTRVLYLTFNLIERYLDRTENFPIGKFQLLGMTCFWICNKFESDEYHPRTYASRKSQIKIEDLISMEKEVLSTLDYDVNAVVSLDFFEYLTNQLELTMEEKKIANYYLEKSLSVKEINNFTSYTVALACIDIVIEDKDKIKSVIKHSLNLEDCVSELVVNLLEVVALDAVTK